MSRPSRGIFWLILTISFMTLIFLKSAEPYQEQDLKPTLAAWIPLSSLRWLPRIEFQYDTNWVTWQQPYAMIEFFIRKAAHVTEYAILMFLVSKTLAFYLTRKKWVLLFSALFTVLYAASDEWHQTFIPYRTGHWIDVGVDAIGVGLILLYYIVRPDRIRS